MTVPSWQGEVNRLLYGLLFEADVDDRVVEEAASGLLEGQVSGADPEATCTAISQALASGAVLTGAFETRHSEATFRDFLTRLRARLDQLRPWPQPPYRKLGLAEWDTFGASTPVATVLATPLELREQLHLLFDQPAPDSNGQVAVLRLRTGQTVALVGTTGKRGVTLLQREPGDPAATRAAFAELTGYPADRLVPFG